MSNTPPHNAPVGARRRPDGPPSRPAARGFTPPEPPPRRVGSWRDGTPFCTAGLRCAPTPAQSEEHA